MSVYPQYEEDGVDYEEDDYATFTVQPIQDQLQKQQIKQFKINEPIDSTQNDSDQQLPRLPDEKQQKKIQKEEILSPTKQQKPDQKLQQTKPTNKQHTFQPPRIINPIKQKQALIRQMNEDEYDIAMIRRNCG
ncbi:MAG: hypothetical protein EZS28_005506 [Streblomastix strix]|uniref:Uncharacterized protein n=1 Tax=Streblomastix strix TaxID=222440 RepID=A0A5J4WVF7_9EUKA|nr:MAG: hypothetical protein EZS28_005506 [Streblomastix strix]